jgi:hypothetical protein
MGQGKGRETNSKLSSSSSIPTVGGNFSRTSNFLGITFIWPNLLDENVSFDTFRFV